MKFVSGMAAGLCAVIFVFVVGSVISPQAPADLPPVTKAKQLDPVVVANARAAFNEDLFKAVAPEQPVPEMTDEVAVASASFADAMRAATGDVPDPLPLPAAVQNPTDVAPKPNYFELWDDLMKRCYAAVALHQEMDETELTTKGDDRINYAIPDTKQTWFAANKAFKLSVSTRKGYGGPDLLRTCHLKTNRFAKVSEDSLQQLKGRFHAWWAAERLAQGTTDLKYKYKLHDRHKWYGGQTTFGSAQGCALKVEVSAITIAKETEVSFFLTESDKQDCDLGSGSGAGGKVRINRLPQVSD